VPRPFRETAVRRKAAVTGPGVAAMAVEYVIPSSQVSDVPRENGQLSDALKERLAQEDLLDLEVLLRYRGVRTLRALDSLETNERAVLLCKARELYELLGIFPSNLKKALDKLFGNGEACGPGRGGVLSTNPWPLQPGSVGSTASALSASAPAFVSPLWAGGGGSSSSSSSGPAPVGPGLLGSPQVAELPVPADDDTLLKKTLAASLEGAREIVGRERYAEAVRRLRRSDELIVASCLEAAEALAALGVRKEELRDREKKEQLKAAKKAARDVLLWRCTGSALGLDSREALVRCFEEACRHTNCDENTVSQLTNGYRRVREELAGGPPAKQRTAAASPSRSRAPGRQEAGTTTEARSPRGAAPGRSGADGAQPAQGAVPVESSQGWSPMAPPSAQVMNQPAILGQSLGASLLAPGAPVRQPPGLERCPLQAKDSERSFDKKTEGSVRSCSLPRRPSAATHRQSSQRPSPLYESSATVVEEKAPDSGIEPPKVHGRLATVLAQAVLQELTQADDEHCGQCAAWLARVLDFSIAGRDSGLVTEAQDGLACAVQREGLQEKCARQVMRSLARVAGSELPRLQVFEVLGGGQGDAGDGAASSKQAALVPMLAETWAWLLVDGQDGQRLQLKVDPASDEDGERLKTLADCTMAFLKRCRKKEVARDCCSALGALGRAAKEMLPLLQRIADWLVETIEEFGGYPEVVHEGFGALIDVCKERGELFSLDLSPERSGQEQQETLSQHLRDKAMGLALTFEGKADFHKDVVMPAFRLLAHTHPWDQVVRFICSAKHRPSCEMMLCAMDEIHESLRPVIRWWAKELEDTGEDVCSLAKVRRNWVSSALRKAQKHGGIGLEALKVLSPAVAAGALVEAGQDFDRPNLQLLVDWARGASPRELQDRFLLVGLVFDARALHQNLMPHCGSAELFAAGCGALVDLDSLEPLHELLKRDIACSILRIPAPQVPSSCTAWVRVIGMALQAWSKAEEDSGHIQLAERAGREVENTIRRVLGCEGWDAFIPEALAILQGLFAQEELQDLAEYVKAKNAAAASTYKQADQILAKVPSKDVGMAPCESGLAN
jgi:hypothetical protein